MRIVVPIHAPKYAAQAASEHRLLYYTGKQGLYSSVKLASDADADAVMEIAKQLGTLTKRENLHVTVCYSKTPATDALPEEPAQPIFGMCNEITHWIGHNDKPYIVMKLICPGLVVANSKLVNAGAVPTFIPYAPHISLSDDVQITPEVEARIKQVNEQLARNPINFSFAGYHVGDLD